MILLLTAKRQVSSCLLGFRAAFKLDHTYYKRYPAPQAAAIESADIQSAAKYWVNQLHNGINDLGNTAILINPSITVGFALMKLG